MQGGKVGCRIGCRPKDYEGSVKTLFWPWFEPVTVAAVVAVTFLKALFWEQRWVVGFVVV